MLTFAALLLAMSFKPEMIVSTEWLDAHLHNPLTVVVEVGSRADYDAGHIPGALFLSRDRVVVDCDGLPNELPPVEDLQATFESLGIGDTKRIVIYSREPLLATRTWFTLDAIGHGYRASVLDGGFAKWRAEERTVSTGKLVTLPAPFTIAERPYSVTRFDAVKRLVRRRGNDAIVLIDARPSLQYAGALSGSGIHRPGHIPGAANVPWTANIGANNAFRSPDELRQMYASVGVTDDAVVVTYCRTGMEASMTYFVLRYLGYDVSLYDGSFFEWSASPDTMVARSDGLEPR